MNRELPQLRREVYQGLTVVSLLILVTEVMSGVAFSGIIGGVVCVFTSASVVLWASRYMGAASRLGSKLSPHPVDSQGPGAT